MAWTVERSRIDRPLSWRRIATGSPGRCTDVYRQTRFTLKPGQAVRVLDDSGHAVMAHRRANR